MITRIPVTVYLVVIPYSPVIVSIVAIPYIPVPVSLVVTPYRPETASLFMIPHLLILQSFDWLAAFHLDVLQAVLFIAV